MSAISITPNRVIFSNGLFDSNLNYLQVKANGDIPWPPPAVTVGAVQYSNSTSIYFTYKNGIGGVPALYSGSNPISFRMGK